MRELLKVPKQVFKLLAHYLFLVNEKMIISISHNV